jgi:hypothetical protein
MELILQFAIVNMEIKAIQANLELFKQNYLITRHSEAVSY